MNDFTKEELEQLMSGLDWIIDRGQHAAITFHARIKLQSLIDNYCEHEPLHDLSRGECLHCDKNLCHECGSEIE